jgi:hypothetical protein
MGKKITALPVFFIASLILLVSIFRTASVKYVFSQEPSPSPEKTSDVNIDYDLPEAELTPENLLWPVQAVIDMGESSYSEYLENADVRLSSGEKMFNKGKIEEGVAVLQKGEQYLAKSYEAFVQAEDDNYEFLYTISVASLKHREVLERVLTKSPDDARAVIAKMMDVSKNVYTESGSSLLGSGLDAPEYPF